LIIKGRLLVFCKLASAIKINLVVHYIVDLAYMFDSSYEILLTYIIFATLPVALWCIREYCAVDLVKFRKKQLTENLIK